MAAKICYEDDKGYHNVYIYVYIYKKNKTVFWVVCEEIYLFYFYKTEKCHSC